MQAVFRDKLLQCEECGNEFVYTVGQQRMAIESTGTVEEPTLCPVCEVKLARGVRRSAIQSQARREESHATFNGHANGTHNGWATAHPSPNGHHVSANRVALDEEPDSSAPDEDEAESPASTYRTGEAHPLFGHEGETRGGEVKWFNDRKGFGFITLDDGNELFVHYSGIVSEGYKTLKQGQRVRLVLEDTDKGPQASQVRVADEEAAESAESAA